MPSAAVSGFEGLAAPPDSVEHLRINLKRLISCCLAAPMETAERRLHLKAYLEDARAMLSRCQSLEGDTSRTSQFAQDIGRQIRELECTLRRATARARREALCARRSCGRPEAPHIPPVTPSSAARAQLGCARGEGEAHQRKSEQTASSESRKAASAENSGNSESAEPHESVISELADMVRVFKDKASSMGQAVRHDIKAMEDTEFLMQKNLGKLETQNKVIQHHTGSEWKQTLTFAVLLGLSVLMFLFMVAVIIWFRAR
eukprot:RCo055260